MACSGSGGGGGALSSRRGRVFLTSREQKTHVEGYCEGCVAVWVCLSVRVLRQVMGVLREPLCPSVRVGVAQKEENRIPA